VLSFNRPHAAILSIVITSATGVCQSSRGSTAAEMRTFEHLLSGPTRSSPQPPKADKRRQSAACTKILPGVSESSTCKPPSFVEGARV
jgi:hypothetical protein